MKERKRSTIRSIAEYVQLSPTTISLALRGDASIPLETRNRVLAAARELNYTYVSRRKIAASRGNIRHLVYAVKDYGDQPVDTNPFYGQILRGVEEACQEQGAKLGFVILPHEFPNETDVPAALIHNVDGIIMSSPYPLRIISRVAKMSGCPVVLVDNMFPGSPYDTIMADDFGGAYQATQHLLQLGHTRIKLIMGLALSQDIPPSYAERYRGYCAACEAANAAPLCPAMLPPEIEKDFARQTRQYWEWCASLIAAEPDITAFFGAGDGYAITTVQGLQGLGYRVPESYSVVGFDDHSISSLTSPPLTTVRSYKRIMGTLAARQLLARLGGDTTPPLHITVGTDLILRGTTAVCRANGHRG